MTESKRQEQQDAREEISEVTKDILRMQLPIQIPGLGHVNMYALVDDDGVAVIDPGLPGEDTWNSIKHRLKQAGLEPRHIHTVFITHSHPDHSAAPSRSPRNRAPGSWPTADSISAAPAARRATPICQRSIQKTIQKCTPNTTDELMLMAPAINTTNLRSTISRRTWSSSNATAAEPATRCSISSAH